MQIMMIQMAFHVEMYFKRSKSQVSIYHRSDVGLLMEDKEICNTFTFYFLVIKWCDFTTVFHPQRNPFCCRIYGNDDWLNRKIGAGLLHFFHLSDVQRGMAFQLSLNCYWMFDLLVETIIALFNVALIGCSLLRKAFKICIRCLYKRFCWWFSSLSK